LKVVDTKDAVEESQTRIGQSLHLTRGRALGQSACPDQASKSVVMIQSNHSAVLPTSMQIGSVRPFKIAIGQVLAVTKDTDGKWKDEVSHWKTNDAHWYFLVTEILTHKSRGRTFHGLWLYKPSDTACARMKYPFPNELFLSDNCSCGNTGIREEEVIGVVDVAWHGQPGAGKGGLFIRQTYLENERFVTLRNEHKMCEHLRSEHDPLTSDPLSRYPRGQTVLARPHRQLDSPYELEVYVVLQYEEDPDGRLAVLLRRLQRRTTYDDTATRNELVYTQIIDRMMASRIYGTCSVRCFVNDHQILPPYNRGGVGNLFYMTQERVLEGDGASRLQPLLRSPVDLIQAFDPAVQLSQEKLAGMDLYCGGGNFGRGLEEGGAVENRYAVDLDKAAIHTYHANLPSASNTKLYFGSVDDLLLTAMQGNPHKDECVPLPGDVDFISAGSPCQGFSLLNPDKTNDRSLKNQSLVASVAAYVDFYRPKYGILENVVTMARVCPLYLLGSVTQLTITRAAKDAMRTSCLNSFVPW
jgi:DNA (cytosine-5)-methyltransferase 1